MESLDAERDWYRSDAVHTEAWNVHEPDGTKVVWVGSSVSLGGCRGQDQEWVRTGGGGGLPEDGAPPLLRPDTVGVVLTQQ